MDIFKFSESSSVVVSQKKFALNM